MAAAVRCMTGAMFSRKTSSMMAQISPNVREPSHNSHKRLFIWSKGRRISLGARSSLANHPSMRPNCLGIRKTTRRPVAPGRLGSFSTDPIRAHQTGVLQGYCSASGWSSIPASDSTPSPQNSVQVQTSNVSMAAVPRRAVVRVVCTRVEKLRKYHVPTPHVATTTHSAYHAGG